MFRPAGFRPVLRRRWPRIRDTAVPWADVVGADAGRDLAAAWPPRPTAGDGGARGRRAGAARPRPPAGVGGHRRRWSSASPPTPRSSPSTTSHAYAGATARQFQRRFADHVGLGPKAVIRRYRLYEAAERARGGQTVDWAGVAASLGYSDQAHLTRDFTEHFGLPPGRYLPPTRPADPAPWRGSRPRPCRLSPRWSWC